VMRKLLVLRDTPDSMNPHFVNKRLCTKCGGRCCQTLPGSTSPEDWGAPDHLVMVTRISEALASGLYAIDWWEGDPRGLDWGDQSHLPCAEYIRPATVGVNKMRDPSRGGTCVFWSQDRGCELKHDARPLGCRNLEPKSVGGEPGSDCDSRIADGFTSEKHENAVRWIPYRGVIKRAEKLAIALRKAKAKAKPKASSSSKHARVRVLAVKKSTFKRGAL
jgi:hypothetical protein